LISFLLSKGAKVENELNSESKIEYNINTPSFSSPNLVGIPPLLLACEKKNLDIVKMLVLTHPNININVFDKYGKTPLMIAVANYSLDIVEFLLTHPNINVNQRDGDGRTALFIATRNMNMDIINHLAHNGADFTICDKDGNSPLDMANDLGVKLKTF
jgi:ankyrin repeat protein